jgi:glycosyltransferase involved in cell wall biosynthesis
MPAAPIVAATVATSAAPASANASPQVSVVIACPDEARYLAEAVDSVLHQTFAPWEIIIVSDGRPDDASPAARRLIQAHPDRSIRLVEKAAGGLADARNAGIRRARGRYILPLNADDRLHPQMLEKTVALLEREPTVGIAYTDWAIFGAHSAVRQAVDFDVARLCTAENLFAYAALFRREAWEAAGGYNRNMTQGFEDWDFWVACAKHGQVGRRIPEPLLLRRARRAGALDAVSAHRRAMFARIVLNHPEIYAAGDIAAAQALLASAPPPPAPAASDGREWAPTPAPEDIFAKPEADNLCRIVDHYRHTPSDPGAIAQVLTLRQGIADFLRGVAPGRLEALFLGTFGLVYRRLLHSGVQCAAASPTSADPRLAWAQAVKQCEADDPTHALPVRLAALLFLQSPEAVFPTAQGAVPAWFRDDFGSLRPAASRVLAVKTDPVASAETNALPV